MTRRVRLRRRRPPAPAGSLAAPRSLLLGARLLPAAGRLGRRRVDEERGELFTTFTFAGFNGGLRRQHRRPPAYRDGVFWRWMANTALYAGGRRRCCRPLVSGARRLRAGEVPLPRPQRDLQRPARRRAGAAASSWPSRSTCCWPRSGLTDTYWSVLLPSIISPFGIYLARIYAAAAVPDDDDRGGPHRRRGRAGGIFRSVALPMMVPGLVTVFLFQFVAHLEQLPAAVHHARRRRDVPAHRRPLHAAQPGRTPAGPVHPRDHRRAAVDHPADRAVPDAAALLAGRPGRRSGEG